MKKYALFVILPFLLLASVGQVYAAPLPNAVLTWADKSDDETGFKIERKTGTAGAWTEITRTAANITSYTDPGLAYTMTFCYRVRAYNAGGDSTYSNEACKTTAAQTAPAAPTNLTIAATSAGPLVLSWPPYQQNETPADRLVLSRNQNGGAWSQVATLWNMQTVAYTDRQTKKNRTFCYELSAWTSTGQTSAASNRVCAKARR